MNLSWTGVKNIILSNLKDWLRFWMSNPSHTLINILFFITSLVLIRVIKIKSIKVEESVKSFLVSLITNDKKTKAIEACTNADLSPLKKINTYKKPINI